MMSVLNWIKSWVFTLWLLRLQCNWSFNFRCNCTLTKHLLSYFKLTKWVFVWRKSLNLALNFYTSAVKGLKHKVRKIWGQIPTFVEVTEEKRVGDLFARKPSILNRVKVTIIRQTRLRNNFSKYRRDANKRAYNAQKNLCVSQVRKAK